MLAVRRKNPPQLAVNTAANSAQLEKASDLEQLSNCAAVPGSPSRSLEFQWRPWPGAM